MLVKFVPGTPPGLVNRALGQMAGRHLRTFERIGVHHWRAGRGVSTEEALETLARPPFRDFVEYAEPNYIRHTTQIYPDDALRGDLWNLHNFGQTGGTYGADIGAMATWAGSQAGTPPVVAVIDTGVEYTHPDLAANMWQKPDGSYGWDFVNNDNNPIDDNGHGTHVAGTIGAVANNGIGVVGVSWQARIMAVKFLNAGGSGSDANAIAAINWARDNGATIMNASWGGGPKSQSLSNAINACNCLFVAAAGNSGNSKVNYPAGYPLTNILSVAATDHNDALATFSSYGSTWVDLAAPGVNVLSTYRGGGYRTMSGTSMAAPHVTGVAALLLANSPNMTSSDVKQRILTTVDALSSLAGKVLTGGRLSAAAAIDAERPSFEGVAPGPVTGFQVVGIAQRSLTLSWTSSGDNGNVGEAYLYDVRYSKQPISEGSWASATPAKGEPCPQPAGSHQEFTFGDLDTGTTYFVGIKAIDDSGNSSALVSGSGTTEPGPMWVIEKVAQGADIYFASYHALAFDALGDPLVAFRERGTGRKDYLRFATKSANGWSIVTADVDGFGVDLALYPDGRPAMSHGWGALRFTVGTPNGSSWSWQSQVLETGPQNDHTSLAFNNGQPSIAYWSGGSNPLLKRMQQQDSGSWLADVVDPRGGHWGLESSLAFDGDGNPAIAYGRVDEAGKPTVLAFAHWNGSGWDLENVEAGVQGYGGSPSLAYDHSGNPAIVHSGPMGVRFLRRVGTGWQPEVVDAAGGDASLAFDPYGQPVIAYSNDSRVWFAKRVGEGQWNKELVDSNALLLRRVSLKFDPSGCPAILYIDQFGTHELRLARIKLQ